MKMETMEYGILSKCPIKNIPSKILFQRLKNRAARVELVCRGWDIKSILRANNGLAR